MQVIVVVVVVVFFFLLLGAFATQVTFLGQTEYIVRNLTRRDVSTKTLPVLLPLRDKIRITRGLR